MTAEQFQKDHGASWKQFERTETGVAFLRLIEDQHPLRSIPSGEANMGLRLNGAVVMLNEIAGYESLAGLIRNLGNIPEKAPEEVEDSFSEPEDI